MIDFDSLSVLLLAVPLVLERCIRRLLRSTRSSFLFSADKHVEVLVFLFLLSLLPSSVVLLSSTKPTTPDEWRMGERNGDDNLFTDTVAQPNRTNLVASWRYRVNSTCLVPAGSLAHTFPLCCTVTHSVQGCALSDSRGSGWALPTLLAVVVAS